MRFFPFNLNGPQFLVFFILFGTLCVVVIPLMRRLWAPSDDFDAPLPRLTDPLEIATLRGGFQEAVRLVTIVLIDRGLLRHEGNGLSALPGGGAYLSAALEIAVFRYFLGGGTPSGVFGDPAVRDAGQAIELSLEARGLRVPEAKRRTVFFQSLSVIAGVALVRIWISGPPFLLLIIECCLFIVVANWVRLQGINGRGRRLMSQLRELFVRLERRAKDLERGAQGREIALLGAVFGFGALPFAVARPCACCGPRTPLAGAAVAAAAVDAAAAGAVGAAAEDAAGESF
jgi:uncharacterized protein (TIGR04222 family)